MPRLHPQPIWSGRDAYIIGGGSSLEGFDFDLLMGRCTIGVNQAFLLGPEVCSVCFFGDHKFLDHFHTDLAKFTGLVVTSSPQLANSRLRWLHSMDRSAKGLHYTSLGWNGNSGASAINLALIFGARRVFLLGFDMNVQQGRHHWHDKGYEKVEESVYDRFLQGFNDLARDWKRKFSDREIVNATSGSRLSCFPKVDFDQFWKQESKND